MIELYELNPHKMSTPQEKRNVYPGSLTRGGVHRSKLTVEEKEQVKKWVDEECSLTL